MNFAGINILIEFVVVLAIVAGAFLYSPTLSTPRKEWLKRSIIAGIFVGLGVFCLVIIIFSGAINLGEANLLGIALFALATALIGAVFMAAGTFIRINLLGRK